VRFLDHNADGVLIQTTVFKTTLIHFTGIATWLAPEVGAVTPMALAFSVMQRRIFTPSNSPA
jgi:hypothetical protein